MNQNYGGYGCYESIKQRTYESGSSYGGRRADSLEESDDGRGYGGEEVYGKREEGYCSPIQLINDNQSSLLFPSLSTGSNEVDGASLSTLSQSSP